MQATLDDVARDPLRVWAALHAEGGVARIDDGWLLGRFAVAEAAIGASALRTAGAAGAPMAPHLARSEGYRAFARFWSNAMVMHHGDRHARLRRAVQAEFVQRVHDLEAMVREIADQLVDALPTDRPFDLVTDLAAPLPVHVMAHVLGVDREELLALEPAAEALSLYLGGADDELQRQRALDGAHALWTWFDAATPSVALGGLLARLRDRGELSPAQLVAQAILVFTAGHQTTRDALCGAVYALALHPTVQVQARAQRLAPERIVDEVLRWDGPVQVAMRVAAEPVALDGAAIARGERVLICLGAANRDPARYDAADEFRPDLSRPRHLAFGSGPHACLGGALARLELQAAITALLARGELRLAGPPVRVANVSFRRIAAMPVTLSRAR